MSKKEDFQLMNQNKNHKLRNLLLTLKKDCQIMKNYLKKIKLVILRNKKFNYQKYN